MQPSKAGKIIGELSGKGLDNMASVYEFATTPDGTGDRFSHSGFNSLPEGAEPGRTIMITTRQKATVMERIRADVADNHKDVPGIKAALANMGFLLEEGQPTNTDPASPQLQPVVDREGQPAAESVIENGQRITSMYFIDHNPQR